MTLRSFRQTLKLKTDSLTATIRKRILGKHGFAILCRTASGIYAIDPEDCGVGGQFLQRGSYGQDELNQLAEFLSPDCRVLVVGAHIGSLAIPIAGRVKELVAIEANPNTFQLLEMNIALNRVENIKAVCIAVSDRREQIPFLLSRANSGGSKRKPLISDHRYYYDHPQTVSVEAYALDEFLTRDFDVIVMDIEGSEVFALRGMQRLLSKARILQIEFLPHHLKNVAGVSVPEFLRLIRPHFQILRIPSLDRCVEEADFTRTLEEMFAADQGDDGLVFIKA